MKGPKLDAAVFGWMSTGADNSSLMRNGRPDVIGGR
jgi:hypothetical protein